MTDPYDALPDGVVCLDADRRVTSVNGAALELTGLGRDELVGQ